MSLHRLVAAALLSTAAVACAASAPPPVTLTAGEVAQASAPPAPAAAPPATPELPADAGKLVCRAARADIGTVELYLTWTNGTAKGLLRTTAPSGNVTQVRVGAESSQGVIVVDDLLSGDLVEHAAVVRNHVGKRLLRLNGAGSWLTCTYDA